MAVITIDEKIQKIDKLRSQIAKCQRCSLHKTRTNTVPGEGNVDAKIMFIGEAPGRNEDLQGKPFVGKAGDIFDRLLGSVNLTRKHIYLCNILKCRPPNNRNPHSSEIENCIGSLNIQMRVINPEVIGTLGNFATAYIFKKFSLKETKISQVHGQIFEVETIFGVKKVVPLFHPAVVTYDPRKIDILLEDFKIFPKLI